TGSLSVQRGDVVVTAVPLVALAATALGATSVVFPGRGPSPEAFVEAADAERATIACADAATWRRVAEHCTRRRETLGTVSRAVVLGPAAAALHEQVAAILAPGGQTLAVQGTVESLPLALITGTDALETRELSGKGAGRCVGKPLHGLDIVLIRTSDGFVPAWRKE